MKSGIQVIVQVCSSLGLDGRSPVVVLQPSIELLITQTDPDPRLDGLHNRVTNGNGQVLLDSSLDYEAITEGNLPIINVWRGIDTLDIFHDVETFESNPRSLVVFVALAGKFLPPDKYVRGFSLAKVNNYGCIV